MPFSTVGHQDTFVCHLLTWALLSYHLQTINGSGEYLETVHYAPLKNVFDHCAQTLKAETWSLLILIYLASKKVILLP